MLWSNSSPIAEQLTALFRQLIQKVFPSLTLQQVDDCLEITTAKQASHGHYQCNSALKLSKQLRDNPRNIAKKLLITDHPAIASCEIAGAGFINITLKTSYLEKELNQLISCPRLGIQKVKAPKRVIVEFSSPNTAKELHVGHLRSTIIGDCLSHLFEFLGHDVLRLNHVGNWGTPFGMLIHFLKTKHPGVLDGSQPASLSDLASWYKESRKCFDLDETFKKKSQEQVVKLQAQEKESMAAWKKICEISREGYQAIYDLLNVRITERGESFYMDQLSELVTLFESKKLTQVSDGAKCIFLEGFVAQDNSPLPLIIQKSDGGYNYATTDLAALYQRIHVEKADRIIYVVDNGQSLHFQMVFKAAIQAGYYDPQKTEVTHVPFGLVLGSDGKKFKTRSGDSEKLIDLLHLAISKSKQILENRKPPIQNLDQTAQVLGINAVKYADLSSLRTKDYPFSYDKMLQFEGNTAAFLLYAFVRIQSIERKAGFCLEVFKDKLIDLKHPQEIALGLHVLQLKEVLESVAHSLLPNRLCDYLYQLADKFNAFFRDCPVINSPEKDSRLLLCSLVKKTFEIGFSILGLGTVEKM